MGNSLSPCMPDDDAIEHLFRLEKCNQVRKSSGLWAFGFASLHILLYIREANLMVDKSMPLYLALGSGWISTLSALSATSNRWSMQWLGKNWSDCTASCILQGSRLLHIRYLQ